jgi:hypothetical protein
MGPPAWSPQARRCEHSARVVATGDPQGDLELRAGLRELPHHSNVPTCRMEAAGAESQVWGRLLNDKLRLVCARCGRSRERGEFHDSRTGQFSYCKECRRAYDRAYYATRGHVRRKERQAARRERIREWIAEMKRGVACMDCGGLFPSAVMHFDHLPGHQKVAPVSSLALSRTRTLVLEELKKCELVCANCHAVRTAARRRGVAQPGRALVLGASGREFESLHPDSQGTST